MNKATVLPVKGNPKKKRSFLLCYGEGKYNLRTGILVNNELRASVKYVMI
jgi:hypothetical protein